MWLMKVGVVAPQLVGPTAPRDSVPHNNRLLPAGAEHAAGPASTLSGKQISQQRATTYKSLVTLVQRDLLPAVVGASGLPNRDGARHGAGKSIHFKTL